MKVPGPARMRDRGLPGAGVARQRSAITIAALALVLWTTPCTAASPEVPEPDFTAAVDLPSMMSYALAHNPEIQAMEQRRRAAQARPSQEGSLPDPLLNTAYHNESFTGLEQGESDFSWLRLGLEQELPFPGKLALREKIAAREADREGAVYAATVLNVLTRVRLAYNDYALAYRSNEVLSSNKELLQRLSEGAEARYRVGEGLQQDIVRAQVEQSMLLGRLVSLDQERASAAAMLNAALNRQPADPLGPPKPVEKLPLRYTREELERFVKEKSPSLQAASFDIARAQAKLDLARRAYYPDFVVRVDYLNKGSLTPEWEVGAGIRVPLYFWRKQASGVEEATAGVSEARATWQNTSQEVMGRLADLFAQATSAQRLVELYGTGVVPQAEVSLSSATSGYQVGKVDFLMLLNSFTVLNEYQLRYYEELAKFDKAVAQLEELAGVPPVPEATRLPDTRELR
ncbi:MAG: TolC family protein [Deltaproteobacteria bacterium]|nr:TolC family protein [Deltaproteobacteria bacterium]